MLSLRFLADWKYDLDLNGAATRHIPKGIVIELEEEVAAAAIAAGVAEPLRPLSAEVANAVAFHKQVLDLMAEGLTVEEALGEIVARAEASADGTPDAGPGADQAAGEPPAKPAKKRAAA